MPKIKTWLAFILILAGTNLLTYGQTRWDTIISVLGEVHRHLDYVFKEPGVKKALESQNVTLQRIEDGVEMSAGSGWREISWYSEGSGLIMIFAGAVVILYPRAIARDNVPH